jgi:hypothetical protein
VTVTWTLLELAGIHEGIAAELLQAERDTLLLDVDIENDSLQHVALACIPR